MLSSIGQHTSLGASFTNRSAVGAGLATDPLVAKVGRSAQECVGFGRKTPP
jgi:hypothetical protein